MKKIGVLAALLAGALIHAAPGDSRGLRDPAWAPDGKHLAASWYDRIWTFEPDGKGARRLTSDAAGSQSSSQEREPAWSRDGTQIAFAADGGDGFDIYLAMSKGGAAQRITSMQGDERWPSWTNDGRIVFAHRDREESANRPADSGLAQWDLYIVSTSGGEPQRLTETPYNEMQPRVSPDGQRIAFVSDRDSEDRDLDLWVMPVRVDSRESGVDSRESGVDSRESRVDSGESGVDSRESRVDNRESRVDNRESTKAIRVLRARGMDGYPSWAPGSDRIAFFAVRENVGSLWVVNVDPPPEGDHASRVVRQHPAPGPVLVSRHGGAPAWSPDGRTIVIGALPEPEPDYNGNPDRAEEEPPPSFQFRRAFALWTVPAPEPVAQSARSLGVNGNDDTSRFSRAFDRVWDTLHKLYYSSGPAAAQWDALRSKYRPEAASARDDSSFETTIDRMILEQPLIKPAVTSEGAVVVSGNALASEAGRQALEKGGNVVDAMIATSFALGVVEPDASGVGGDGQAILYLKGMSEPTVVEYKDQTPIHATLDNTKIFKDGRIVADGAAAMNIPGTVAGLDYLYHHYASGKVAWADLIAPAIKYAEDGFVLDDALPTTIAEGRQYLQKYPEARHLFLPNDNVPKPGDRWVNRDYAGTLRAIATGGADAFYHGDIAHRIVADLEANGGIIGLADLAQYRAIERRPLHGRFRGYHVFGPAPPVSDGARIIETLQILDNFKPRAGAQFTTDPDYFHYLIESWKARENVRRIGDPAHWPVEIGEHLTAQHAATLFKKIDPRRAAKLQDDDDEESAAPPTRIGRGTTAFAVADADGNMIVVTQTLSTWGGNFYVSKGLGFLYNNHLRSTRTQPGYGQLLPLTRSGTTNSPTLVFADNNGALVPRLGVGCAGNAWITSSIYSIIANVIDGGLPMQKAIEAPRFLIGRDPSDPAGTGARIQIEDRIPRSTLDDLIARGHVFQKIGRKGEVRYGYASAVLVDPQEHRVEAGTEPRRSHGAVATK